MTTDADGSPARASSLAKKSKTGRKRKGHQTFSQQAPKEDKQ